MYSALSTFNTTTEVSLSKAPNPQLLPGRHSINAAHCFGCVFTMPVNIWVHGGRVISRVIAGKVGLSPFKFDCTVLNGFALSEHNSDS